MAFISLGDSNMVEEQNSNPPWPWTHSINKDGVIHLRDNATPRPKTSSKDHQKQVVVDEAVREARRKLPGIPAARLAFYSSGTRINIGDFMEARVRIVPNTGIENT